MNNIHPTFQKLITREKKEGKMKQRAKVFWFTGLSGAGKTTLAEALERKLFDLGYLTQILDGDIIRSGLNNKLSFTKNDREENIRRIAEINKLFINCGVITLCAFVSPTERTRHIVKDIVGADNFFEIFVSTPLEVCEHRDVKGLYAKARAGLIPNFTGINSPFEIPKNADFTIDTTVETVDECISKLTTKIVHLINY
jgi:adenylylsulfate kinase